MKTKSLLFLLSFCVITLAQSCKKDDDSNPDFRIIIQQRNGSVEVTNDTILLASDYTFEGKAVVKSAHNIASAKYTLLYDEDAVVTEFYTPEQGEEFWFDSVGCNIDYALLAGGSTQYVTLMFRATEEIGNTVTSHLTFKLQPVSYPFYFHFFDFNDNDTLAVGDTAFISPFYSPLDFVHDHVATMKVYRKVGFAAEELVATLDDSDFFYYQSGYLNQISYVVPVLPSGSGISHRFELDDTNGKHYVLQHRILVQ